MPKVNSQSKVNAAADAGPSLQVSKVAADLDVALTLTPVPNGGNVQSLVIRSCGYRSFSIGVKSTQIGALNVQRYLDEAGTIPIGALITVALAAGVANWVSSQDGVPFGSFQITVTNTSGTPATLSNFALLMQGF